MAATRALDGDARGSAAPEISQAGGERNRSLFQSRATVWALSLFIGIVLTWSKALAVWTTNRFFDTDDAMRLVQVRDWLAGQAWFDMVERRLDPPTGTLMHWSRVVDAPLAALIELFRLFASQDMAERLTRIVYPLALQACLYAALLWTARKLLGFRGAAAATILAACSMSVIVQFSPGRITHHNLQIVLLVSMLGFSLDALNPERARRAALAALAAALSLSVSLENLPFIGVMIAFYAVVWIARGQVFARALAWFAGAFCIALAMAFATTVPSTLYGAKFCDAFSAAHLIPGEIGSAALLTLAVMGSRLNDPRFRGLACVCAGAATLGILARIAPQCIGDPYGSVDPLVRSVWLSRVTEAQPLAALFKSNLSHALPIALPVLLGAISSVAAALHSRGDERVRWLLVAAFLWTGMLGSAWQIILGTYVAALACLGVGWSFERLLASKFARAACLASAALLALMATPQAWALIGLKFSPPQKPPSDCLASDAFTAFAQIPPGVVLASIDAGPYILAFSRQSVVDGPYHRDNRGNRLAIEAMTSSPAIAHEKVVAAGATYVALCPTSDEAHLYEALAPHGLAAALSKSAVPAWLEEIAPAAKTPFRIFRVE